MLNLTQFSVKKNGRVRLVSPCWEDLRFPVQGINPPGAVSDPTRNTTTGLLEFSKSASNIIVGVAQLPHSWKQGSEIRPHIHVLYKDTGSGNSVWKFEYKVASVDGSFPATYSADTKTFAASGSSTKHTLHAFDGVAMTGKTSSAIVLWKLSRLGAEATDTYDEVIPLLEFDIHYQVDWFGSGSEYIKSEY